MGCIVNENQAISFAAVGNYQLIADHRDNSLHIAFLTPEFVTETKFDGGLANYLNRVTRALADAGHTPEVFVLSDRDETIDHAGIPVHRVSYAWTKLEKLAYRGIVKFCGREFRMTSELLRGSRALARRVIARHKSIAFDIVQASDFYATGLRLPYSAGFAIVTRLSYYAPAWRAAYESPLTRDRSVMEWLEARAMRQSHFRYAPSSAIAALVERELTLSVDVVFPPAFIDTPESDEDTSIYSKSLAGREYVLFFGRVCKLKGVDTLADAMCKVLIERDNLHIVMVGREDPPGIVNDLRRRLDRNHDRLIYFSRLEHAQLFPIIRGATIVVLPSRVDNFPNTCIESMGLGKIVIGTQGTGFDDLIRNEIDGFLSPREDAAGLADQIIKVLSLPDAKREEISRNAIARLTDFSPDRMIPDLVAYYRRCLALLKSGRRQTAAVL